MKELPERCKNCTDGSDGVPDCVIDGVCPKEIEGDSFDSTKA